MGEAGAGVPAVDISESIRDARREWRQAGDDIVNQEAWATYVVVGELLDSGRKDDAYVREVQDLVARLVELDREQQRQAAQRWAAWVARNTVFGGAGVQ